MKQARVLTDRELKRVLAVADASGRFAPRNRMAIALTYFAGMRICEVAMLTLGDTIDANGHVRDEILLEAEQTKGSRRRRVIVSKKLQKEIQQYIGTLDVIVPDTPLIPSQKNGHFRANALVQLFGRLYRDAGIDGASSHSGRRTFLTNLANKGISAPILQALANHKSLATTQRYIVVNDTVLKQAVDVL